LLADTAYDAPERVRGLRETAGRQIVIPPKTNRKLQREYDTALSKARHLLENVFATLKPFRGMATRDATRARIFLGAVYLAATVIWLN
jgi:transposase